MAKIPPIRLDIPKNKKYVHEFSFPEDLTDYEIEMNFRKYPGGSILFVGTETNSVFSKVVVDSVTDITMTIGADDMADWEFWDALFDIDAAHDTDASDIKPITRGYVSIAPDI